MIKVKVGTLAGILELSRAHTPCAASSSCSASTCTLQQYVCALLTTFTHMIMVGCVNEHKAHGGVVDRHGQQCL